MAWIFMRQYKDEEMQSERNALMTYLGTDKLDEETEYAIRQYSYGCMGQTIDWLLGRIDMSPERLAYYQYKYMPDFLKKAFIELA